MLPNAFSLNFKRLLPLFILVLISGYSLQSRAALNDEEQLAIELLELIKMDRQLSQIGNQVMMPIKQRLSAVRTGPTRAKLIQQHVARIEEMVGREFSWESNKAAYAKMYAGLYDKKELNELISFFSSPTGQKFTNSGEHLNQEVKKLATERMESLKPQLAQLQQELDAKIATLKEAENSVTQ